MHVNHVCDSLRTVWVDDCIASESVTKCCSERCQAFSDVVFVIATVDASEVVLIELQSFSNHVIIVIIDDKPNVYTTCNFHLFEQADECVRHFSTSRCVRLYILSSEVVPCFRAVNATECLGVVCANCRDKV